MGGLIECISSPNADPKECSEPTIQDQFDLEFISQLPYRQYP